MCNTSAGKQKNADDVVELESRVDDWKGHKLERFGLLLISGKHTVLKTDAASKADQEREVSEYLNSLLNSIAASIVFYYCGALDL